MFQCMSGTALCLASTLMPLVLSAQVVRGRILDVEGRGIPAAVVQLVDSSRHVAARGITNVNGEYQLATIVPGSYHLVAQRLGFALGSTEAFSLGRGETRPQEMRLSSVHLQLDTLRISAQRLCDHSQLSSGVVRGAWEQVTSQLTAVAINAGDTAKASRARVFSVGLDANARKYGKRISELREEQASRSWQEAPTDSIEQFGYVSRESDGSVTYRAPGMDLLLSNEFLGSHCLHLVQSADTYGIAFEPTEERKARGIAEIEGTLWMRASDARLQSMEYRYVNLPFALNASTTGNLQFDELKDGSWAVTSWMLRMPRIEQRVLSADRGAPQLALTGFVQQGGELILVTRGIDTLYARRSATVSGILRDSLLGHGLANARVTVGDSSTATNSRGFFVISGLVPGKYIGRVHTPSLDSVAAIHQFVINAGEDSTALEVRVPSASLVTRSLCRTDIPRATGILLGHVVGQEDASRRDVAIIAGWKSRLVPTSDSAVTFLTRVKPDSMGRFRICNAPLREDIAIWAEAGGIPSEKQSVTIHEANRVRVIDLALRPVRTVWSLSGSVSDSAKRPIGNAEVSSRGGGRSVRTDEQGNFRIDGITDDEILLNVRHLGYSVLDTTVVRSADTIRHGRFVLAKITELATMTAVGMRRLSSFEDNRALGLGSFLSVDQLRPQEGRSLNAALSSLRGMRMVNGGGSHGWPSSARKPDCIRGAPCPSNAYGPSGFEIRQGVKTRCYAKVYLDDVLMNSGQPTPPFDLISISVDRLEGVEWYAGASEVPARYSGLDTDCGVLVLWTRRYESIPAPH